jgi:hypothetical protein
MKLVRILEAKPIDGHRVQLTLTDGRVIERDLGPMLAGAVFSEITERSGAMGYTLDSGNPKM